MSKIKFKRIYIEITSSCNLSCTFCQETKRPKVFMSVENFRHILKAVRPYTNFVYLHVKGEPLLHPRLEDILKACQESGVTVNVTTNGTLLGKQLPTLLKYPPHQINISLHSADDNDCIDMDSYIRDVFYSCQEITAKTNTEISLRLWNTKNDPTIFGEKNYKVKDRIHINVQSPFEWPDLDSPYYNDRGFCQGLRLHTAILSDGTVVPCCLDGNAVMALGNILEESFESILNGPRATAIVQGFRDKRAVEPLCQHCSFKERFSNRL